ncbi:MAG: tetratricopeptide repeat protein [Deltaproteobacteria bacterium]|nr:tetratricopeptide repeat protein [Deltaproteobacteria bacterium]
MSLIINAIKKAQQLRLQEIKGIPFFPHFYPAQKKTLKGLANQWVAIVLVLASLFIIAFVIWRPAMPPPPAVQSNPAPEFKEKNLSAPLPERVVNKAKPVLIISPPQVKELFVKPEPFLEGKKEKPVIIPPAEEKIIAKIESPEATAAPLSIPPPPPVSQQEEAPQKAFAIEKEVGKDQALSSESLTHFNMGVHFQNRGENLKAIQAYQKAVSIEPAHLEAYNNLGILYQEMGDWNQALRAYRKAIEINPQYEKALNNLGILFYLQNRYEEASETFQKALAINPLRGEIHYNLGLAYEQSEKIKLAIEHYQAFIGLSAKTHPALVSMVGQHVKDLTQGRKDRSK